LKWDARHEDKGKHGKFDHLWKGPYLIAENHGNNSYSLQEFDGDLSVAGPINGRFLKHYSASSWVTGPCTYTVFYLNLFQVLYIDPQVS
jgi:hypothetical protein